MVKCTTCGADNLLGAIFCRTCGERLKIEDLRPEQVQSKPSALKSVSAVLGKLVTFAVLVAVLLVLAGFFLPAPGRWRGDLGAADLDRIGKAFDQMKMPVVKKPREYTFTAEEVTALANRLLGLGGGAAAAPGAGAPAGGAAAGGAAAGGAAAGGAATPAPAAAGAHLAPEQVSVELLSSGYVRLVLRSRLLGKVPVYSRLLGLFQAGEQGVTFQVYSAAAGRVPMPGPLRGVIVNRFRPLLDGQSDLSSLRNRVTALDVGQDSVKITVGK